MAAKIKLSKKAAFPIVQDKLAQFTWALLFNITLLDLSKFKFELLVMQQTLDEIENIFTNAKTKNEFQFVLTVINYKHIASPEESANLHEWFDAIEFYKNLYNNFSDKEKLRIGLLLYSTFFENSDFYNILGSLCKNSLGFGGSSYLFWKTKKQDRLLGTGEKIRMVTELLSDCSYQNIIDFFSTTHYEQIRNTFFHSAYSIVEDNYILFDSDSIILEGVKREYVSISNFLFPLIDNVILFFDKFKQCYLSSFSNYETDISVKGFFPDLKEVVIHGTENGLKGVTIKNTAQFFGEWVDSGIYFDEQYRFWCARNIRLTSPQIESIEIDEDLTRYEKKEDIRLSDSEFFNLVDKIVDRNLTDEMIRIIHLLIKFGSSKYKKWQDEANPNKKANIKKHPLSYYSKAIQLNKHLDVSELNKRIKELGGE
ncbi:MAG: hypothetical protein MUE72_05550 [Chitinophagaceae bacterium]|jgi:hypothetical protein|nr:hypothetical protein [Chitinophagaceae bacterium]